jgi:hypothetical protein
MVPTPEATMRFFRHLGWRLADPETVANHAVVVTFFTASLALLLAVFVREPLAAFQNDLTIAASVLVDMPSRDGSALPDLGSIPRAFGLPDDPRERHKPNGATY